MTGCPSCADYAHGDADELYCDHDDTIREATP